MGALLRDCGMGALLQDCGISECNILTLHTYMYLTTFYDIVFFYTSIKDELSYLDH